MALAGAPLVRGHRRGGLRAAHGRLHRARHKSGVGDLEVENDAACLALIRHYLSFFPSNCEMQPPRIGYADAMDRRAESLLDLLPSNRPPYDMCRVIAEIVDDGEISSTSSPRAQSIITCLARVGGRPSASWPPSRWCWAGSSTGLGGQGSTVRQPLRRLRHPPGLPGGRARLPGRLGGRAHGNNSARRQDAPRDGRRDRPQDHRGGAQGVRRGLLRHGGRAYERDLLVAWPTGEITVMGRRGHGGHRRQEALRRHPLPRPR